MTKDSVRYVGLDVHKRVVEACFIDTRGQVVHRERFALNRQILAKFATKVLRPTDHVVLEATTNSWAVVDALRSHVAKIVVSNPMATKAIAQAKVKTDKVDALVLAQLLRCEFLPEVWQPDAETLRLRELTGRRATLTGHRTTMRNRIHSVLAMRLIEEPKYLFSTKGLEWLAAVEIDEQGRMLIDSDLRQLSLLQQEIDLLDAELAKRAYKNDPVKLLMTLPSVDMATANALLAAWGDHTRFPDANHAASYLGLVSSTNRSADKCYHGPITKQGNAQARWMLVQAAQHIGKHPGPLGHFFRKLSRRKKRNVAVVATARKLATIAWQLLATNEPYRYATPQQTAVKLAQLRIKATGERRVGGSSKGTKNKTKLPSTPGGSRQIKSLATVYENEGLPALKQLAPGECRTVRASGASKFVAEIAETRRIPRQSSKKASGTETATTRRSGKKSATTAPLRRTSKKSAVIVAPTTPRRTSQKRLKTD